MEREHHRHRQARRHLILGQPAYRLGQAAGTREGPVLGREMHHAAATREGGKRALGPRRPEYAVEPDGHRQAVGASAAG
jgi:hypothetical protein